MRIVIDLQTVQALSSESLEQSHFFRFVQDMIRRSTQDEILVVLNGSLPAVSVRRALSSLLPPESVKAWHAPGMSDHNVDDKPWRKMAEEKIRLALFSSLNPDVLLVPSTAAIPRNDVMLHVSTVVYLDSPSAARSEHTIDGMKHADLVVVAGMQNATGLARELGVEPERFVDGGDAAPLLVALGTLTLQKREAALDLPERPRLAYFSPLPPQRSGIGDYSTELIPELARYYDIDIIVDQETLSETRATQLCTVRPVAWFRANASAYDRIIYHMGNAEFHLYMLDCMQTFPGVVVLHDFFLSGAYGYQEFESGVPYAWTRELYRSHGYGVLASRLHAMRIDRIALDYPSNFSVLRDAAGVIVHSDYSRKLADQWYGEGFSNAWTCIPHLRVPENSPDGEAARARVGLKEDDFVICCFGVLGVAKQNQRLLDAWLLSDLRHDLRCTLIFVGENGTDDYARELVRTIRREGVEGRVHITGWTNTETFRDYLAAADVAVQLRAHSRGETSGTVLDCMNYGVPTIVNACGPMADLPRDAVWMLPEEFDDVQLIDAIETLWRDEKKRAEFGSNARQAIIRHHDPAECARSYALAIETTYAGNRFSRTQLIASLAELPDLPSAEENLGALASAVAQSLPVSRPARTFFIDVSATSRTDLKTGIERVTRALLHEFVKSPPPGYRVEPVYLSAENGRWLYRYARKYTLEILDCPAEVLSDDPIEARAGDVLFSADLAADMVVRAEADGVYAALKEAGVTVSFMVHDLLPLTMPEVFPPGAGRGFEAWLKVVARVSDAIVCVSRAVEQDVCDWLERNDADRNPNLRLCWSHHGADIHASVSSRGRPRGAKRTLATLKERPSFLIVGTIEPRKNHLQVIEAFNLLWRAGVDINLVIVGKEGWTDLPGDQRRNIPLLVKILKEHPERGKRLFWLENISDEYLGDIYAACDCLLAPSLGEGFGLPLIEASSHHIPILARDIPVFREVAGKYAAYFTGEDAASLSHAVERWLAGNDRNGGRAGSLPFLTWSQSATNLASRLIPASKAFRQSDGIRHVGTRKLLAETNERCLYVDVSVVSREDFRTGIQRTVRALFSQLIEHPPEGFTVYPVRLIEHSGYWWYEFAADYYEEYCAERYPDAQVPQGEIDPKRGDVLLGLDLAGSMVVEAERQGVYDAIRNVGATVWFVVYDLLPVVAPRFFPERDSQMHESWLRSISKSDGVICISRSVANEFKDWHERTVSPLHGPAPRIEWFHLGADIAQSTPTRGLPENVRHVLEKLQQRPTFLMVGTVEPRKSYDRVLQAFRQLWAGEVDVNLVIVGKAGWQIDYLIEELRRAPELNDRLFWLEAISDEYLEAVYAASSCLLAASEGEGFGLPLIEAANAGLPLLLRDIPVFREVAGESAFYFNGACAEDIAAAVRQWRALHAEGKAPGTEHMPRLTWQQSAEHLVNTILGAADTELKRTEGNDET